jgi:hypothetical protein
MCMCGGSVADPGHLSSQSIRNESAADFSNVLRDRNDLCESKKWRVCVSAREVKDE